jgi:hypothetical protein
MGTKTIISTVLAALVLASGAQAHHGSHPKGSVERTKAIIHHVFGPWGGQAVGVAGCESRYDTGAENGQYWGLFQLGRRERERFARGHYSGPWNQARAALRYFALAEHSWGSRGNPWPWSCWWAAYG